jgi:hypothetical protein
MEYRVHRFDLRMTSDPNVAMDVLSRPQVDFLLIVEKVG